MSEKLQAPQAALGEGIAQASDGSTAIVNVYHGVVPPAELERTEREALEQRLATLPVDTIPAPAPLPPGSTARRIPPVNQVFVGREGELRALACSLKAGGATAVGQIAAATGQGGIGKSQLASEFAHRYGQYFMGGVFWLSFAEAAAIPGEIALCGAPAGLGLWDEDDELTLEEQVARVAAVWHDERPRVLIFDNCEDETLLERWRPRAGASRVLITSRRSEWPVELGVGCVTLGVLERAESVALLRKHRDDLAEADPELDAIAETLGDLPLALHLAGRFLRTYRRSPLGRPAAYLEQLHRDDLLAHRSLAGAEGTPTGHDAHVGRTFGLSYEQLEVDDATATLARELLARAAAFAPGEPIPGELLRATAPLPEDDPDAEVRREDALNRLIDDLGLMEADPHGALTLHRLVAAYVRGEEPQRFARARDAVEQTLSEAATGITNDGRPAPLLVWQPHLRYVAEAAVERDSAQAGDLLNALGRHLRQVAEFAGAKAALERALAIGEAAFGLDHPQVAIYVNNLGNVLRALGDHAGAKAAFERALAIDEAAFGPEHPNVAIRVNNLGGVLRALGDHAGAKAAFERALAIDEAAFGPEHPNVAIRVNNLGGVLRALGDHAGAKAAFERALAIGEAAFGLDHPQVAIYVNNLGLVLRALGDHAGAKAAFERALAIGEAAFGLDHPQVAIYVNNLGLVLRALGDHAGAKAAYERALVIDEAAFGPDHPNVAIRVNNLGNVLQALGDHAGAKAAYERALAIDEAAFGPEHPEVATDVNNLGGVLRALGDHAGAKAAFERALGIFEMHFGAQHPNVQLVRRNLAALGSPDDD